MKALVIMTNNDITQTKYVGFTDSGITLSSSSIGDSLHIVIYDVTKYIGTSYNDAGMIGDSTKITIDNGSGSYLPGTWTSTIKPDNVTVELDCVVVENNNSVVIAKCDSETTWDDSVFNRIPIVVSGGAKFGYSSINYALFGTDKFSVKGLVPGGWSQYNVDGNGSNLTINDQVTIMGLPESFVNHWVNMGAKAYMGGLFAMLVPPDSS